MAASALWYAEAIEAAFLKKVNFTSDTIKVALTTSSYTPDQDSHDEYADITNQVANGNGYTTGGATLGSPTLTYTSGSNLWTFDGSDVQWTSSSFSAAYAVIYDDTATNKDLLILQNFDGTSTTTNATFAIAWNASGIGTITLS